MPSLPAGPDPAPPSRAAAPVLLRVTDEEIVVLGGDGGPVLLPYLSELASAERDVALLTAYRGLVARGLLTPVDTAAEPGVTAGHQAAASAAEPGPAAEEPEGAGGPVADVPVELPGPLADLLLLRASARRVVCVRRSGRGGEDFRYLHVGAEVVLDEAVSAGGVHTFRLLERAEVAEVVAEYALAPSGPVGEAPRTPDELPPDGGGDTDELPPDGGGDTDELPPDGGSGPDDAGGVAGSMPESSIGPSIGPGVLARLGQAEQTADIVVYDPAGPPGPLLGLFSGPAGIQLVSGQPGATAPVPVRRATRAQAVAAVAALVEAAPQPQPRDAGPTPPDAARARAGPSGGATMAG